MATNEHKQGRPDDSYELEASSDLMWETSPPAAVPPTERGDDAPRKRETAWPTVLAILSFVWGGLSLFFSGCAVAATPFYAAMAKMFEEAGLEDEAADMQVMAEIWWWWVIQGLIGTALAILLIVAGVGLLKRMYRGVRRARIWSWLIVLQLFIMTPTNVYLTEYHGKDATDVDQFDVILAIGTMVFMAMFSLILPIFMLIWFARTRIKDEVSEWPQ